MLEERLKSDVLSELRAFDGRILLATEAEDGSVDHVWETIEDESQVKTLREVMEDVKREMELGEQFQFKRVPITAEKFPEFNDRKLGSAFTPFSGADILLANSSGHPRNCHHRFSRRRSHRQRSTRLDLVFS